MLPDVSVFDDSGNLIHDAVVSDEQLEYHRWLSEKYGCPVCDGPDHSEPCVDSQGYVLPAYAERARAWRKAK